MRLRLQQILQHCVITLRLSDPTKPGHRKILALILIGPHDSIISTANVSCQQKEIWADQIRKAEPLNSLPVELADQIINVRLPPYVCRRARKKTNGIETERVQFSSLARRREGTTHGVS